MENFNILNVPEMEDKDLNGFLNDLCNCYCNFQKNFAMICLAVYNIWSYCADNYFKAKDNEYYNCVKLLGKFGFNKKSISRYKNCYSRFCEGFSAQTVCVKEYFCDFSPSKLFELLPLSYETMENALDSKLIKPEMTVKEIRQFVKTLKDGQPAETVVEQKLDVNEEEIPFVYDPKCEYEYSYFESKTKNQLLNIVWDLQKAYQKLLKKEKKNEK